MQKQDYYYCSGHVSENFSPTPLLDDQRWAKVISKMIARKDEPIFQELWKNEFRMLPSTSDFIVNLVEADVSK